MKRKEKGSDLVQDYSDIRDHIKRELKRCENVILSVEKEKDKFELLSDIYKKREIIQGNVNSLEEFSNKKLFNRCIQTKNKLDIEYFNLFDELAYNSWYNTSKNFYRTVKNCHKKSKEILNFEETSNQILTTENVEFGYIYFKNLKDKTNFVNDSFYVVLYQQNNSFFINGYTSKKPPFYIKGHQINESRINLSLKKLFYLNNLI